MKNLINICKMLPILFLVLGSCKEKSTDPENITVSELADYYLVAEHKTGGNKLLVLSFTKDGNVVKANGHLQGLLRIHEASVENGTFNFDYNSDGKSMYSFDFEKGSDGNLKLKSYDFTYNGASDQLSQAVLVKKTDAFLFTNKLFWVLALAFQIETPNNTEVLQWLDGKRFPVYRLDNFGFKSNNDEFLGVLVPDWKINGQSAKVMLVERGDSVFIGITE